MLPPSFQNTLLALEEKLRRIQTLDRTVRQAATLEEETVAYRMAEQLAEACEQAVLLARSLAACTGRPHVFWEGGPKGKAPRQWRWASPGGLVFPADAHAAAQKGVWVPPPMCGCSCYRRCAGSSRGRQPLRISPCVLVYRHVYAKDRPDRALRDHDNIETNMASDCVAPLCDGGRLSRGLQPLRMLRQRDRRTHRNLCGAGRGVRQVALVGKNHAGGGGGASANRP